MQNPDMRGIEIALDRLQPIAAPLHEAQLHAALRSEEAFEMRQIPRRAVAVAHIDPDHAVMLFRQIGLGFDLVEKLLAGGDVELVDAIAVDVVFPAVIDAANAVLFVAAIEERSAAMRAALIHDADAAR